MGAKDQRTQLRLAEAFDELVNGLSQLGQPFMRFSRNQLIGSFGRELGFSPEHVRKMLKGERTPSRELLEAIAQFFEVPPTYFREYRELELLKRIREDVELLDILYDIASNEEELRHSLKAEAEEHSNGA